MNAFILSAIGVLTLGLISCGGDGPAGPAPYQGAEMIVVSVKDTVNKIYADRLMAINPNDSIDLTPRYILDSARLYTSPRGGKMAYLLEKLGNESYIFIADINGKNVRQLASSKVIERSLSYPVLSPDGRKVVYSTLDGRLIIQNIDGSDQDVLSNEAAFETIPDFNKDGSRLAFHGEEGKLFVVNTDGSGLRLIVDRAQCDPEGLAKVEWSPDGKKLLYVGQSPIGQIDIYTVNVDGAPEPQQLTNDLGGDVAPTWSPDGAQIAWAAFPGDIWVMNADGSGRRNITPNVSNDDSFPVWSPDGKRILFTTRFPTAEVGTLRMFDFRSGETRSIAFKVIRGFWGKF